MNNKSQAPLAWSATDCGPDVGVHLHAARNVAGSIMAIDGVGHLDSLPPGAVCTLMVMLRNELSAAESILENHDAQGGES